MLGCNDWYNHPLVEQLDSNYNAVMCASASRAGMLFSDGFMLTYCMGYEL